MTTKAAFLTAFGGANQPLGVEQEFVRSSGNILTKAAHGLRTGAGPFKVRNSNADAPAGLVANVRASGTLTGAVVIATDVAEIAGKTYTVIAAPAADGDIDLGATSDDTMGNLAEAINQGPGGGVDYHENTVANPTVEAHAKGDVVTVEAKSLDAAIGNAVTISSVDATITASGATLAGGVDGTDYFVIRLTDNTFSLATSKALAEAGTAVTLTDAGTGVHTLLPQVTTLAEALENVLLNWLTAAGTRVIQAPFNIAKFWAASIDGSLNNDPS